MGKLTWWTVEMWRLRWRTVVWVQWALEVPLGRLRSEIWVGIDACDVNRALRGLVFPQDQARWASAVRAWELQGNVDSLDFCSGYEQWWIAKWCEKEFIATLVFLHEIWKCTILVTWRKYWERFHVSVKSDVQYLIFTNKKTSNNCYTNKGLH